MENYHLTKKDEEWKLRKQGAGKSAVTAETKEEAVAKSIKFMQKHGGSLKIHKEGGPVQEERTYPRSVDPRKSKG